MRTLILPLAICLLPAPAGAGTPRVVADIAPVAVLAGAVLGRPVETLVGGGGDPHHVQLRPSQIRALTRAEAVFWIGASLSPWLARAMETGAGSAVSVPLDSVDGITARDFQFGAPAAEPAPGSPDGRTDGRGRDGADPHVWLDPANDVAMIRAIAATAERLDPAGAESYRSGAAAAVAAVESAAARAREILAPWHDARLVVFHDAYSHWAAAFDMTVVAAIADGEAASPGAAALSGLGAMLAGAGADCILVEAQHAPGLAQSLAGDSGVPVGRIDPMAGDTPGGWLVAMAEAVDACLRRRD